MDGGIVNTAPAPRHLSRDDLLIALVDRSDLSNRQARHLKECPACQQELDRIAQRYDQLGKMATQLAPAPRRSIRLSQRRTTVSRYKLRPLVAAGITAAVILLMTTLWPRNPAETPIPASQQTMLSDRELMQQIDALVNSALPPTVQRMAAVTTPQYDEDLINWIVPSIQDDEDML
jgi:hypothetical protein